MKDFLQRGVQLAHLGFRKCVGATPWPDVSAKQRLIGIDVAYAVQEFLVQQRRFHRRFAGVKKSGKFFCVDTERLSARPAETCLPYLQASEPPWINKTQLSSRSQLGHQMSVFGDLGFWCRHQDSPSHSQMHYPLASAGAFSGAEIEDDMLSHPPHSFHLRAFQRARYFRRRGLERLRLASHPDGVNAVSGHALVEPVGNGFNLWQFWHPNRSSHEPAMLVVRP